MTSTLDADEIIAEENLNDTNLASEEETPDAGTNNEEPDNKDETPTPDDGDTPEEPSAEKPEGGAPEKEDQPEEPSNVVTPTASTPTAPVQFDQSKMFDEQGNARPFNEVVNVGAYLADQVKPVEVVGKDGKTYSFLTIKDMEEQFPDGFEAKNSVEKLRFESAIVANDGKFRDAVSKLQEAEQEYKQYSSEAVETRKSNEAIASEYRAMADQGLVPKVGDPNDPKFADSEAVKELNNIIGWMDKKNTENAEKGLGKIQSLYVAKQLMDMEGQKVEKEDKSKQIDQERKEVASLSSSPTPDSGRKQPPLDVPLSRLADEIIASEGLR